MAKYSQAEKDKISNIFLDLKDDEFEITSDSTPIYNCIGFAIGFMDVWVALGHPMKIPWFWWPETVPFSQDKDALIQTFEYFGFEKCDDDSIEMGWDKVALYGNDSQWLHAARIIGPDLYHSKLGCGHDIHHKGDKSLLERTLKPADSYGKVYQYMKRKTSDAHITNDKRPKPGCMIDKVTGKVFPFMYPPHILPTP